MKFIIQRVLSADVIVDKQMIGKINKGYLVFVGICDTDSLAIADKMIQKMLNLRLFSDENGKTNLALKDVNGELLIVSQFTLYADCRKGNRPSFTRSAPPEFAKKMYEYILEECKHKCNTVQHGEFGADMQVSLQNDGPFTIILDSNDLQGTIR